MYPNAFDGMVISVKWRKGESVPMLWTGVDEKENKKEKSIDEGKDNRPSGGGTMRMFVLHEEKTQQPASQYRDDIFTMEIIANSDGRRQSDENGAVEWEWQNEFTWGDGSDTQQWWMAERKLKLSILASPSSLSSSSSLWCREKKRDERSISEVLKRCRLSVKVFHHKWK